MKQLTNRSSGTRWFFLLALAYCGVLLLATPPEAPPGPPESPPPSSAETEVARWAPAVEPKPLSEHARRGLSWLLEHQHPNGGWSQGEESQHMGSSMHNVRDKTNVGDTCAALLALLRSGSTPSTGPHARNIVAGLTYICTEVKDADATSLYVTKTRGTRLQMKLGTFVDTFLASMVLAEVKGKMPDAAGETMISDAFHKVMDKIERNQRPDGTFGGTGWANALSVSMASKGINRMAQNGGMVSEQVRARLEEYAARNFDRATGKFSAAGSAGVDLYANAANLSAMQDSENTNGVKREQLQQKIAAAETPEERKQAEAILERFKATEDNLASAKKAVVQRLEDPRFVAGFGSNGGEEFLSYMNIGESLVVTGGPEWKKWDEKMTANLNRIQNKDGSWTGHHCITGRTFCTAAALLVLMTDRAPVPVAEKFKRR
jgi:hypothetical protein